MIRFSIHRKAISLHAAPFAVSLALVIGLVASVEYAAGDALENMAFPLIVGTGEKIVDESGRDLIGSYSLDPSECDLVQILWATNGIFAPNADGTPNAENPVMMSSYISSETCYGLESPSLFSATIPDGGRINASSPFFVRVYNAPTCQAATFYGDSALVSNNTASTINRIIVSIPATSLAIDPEYAALLDSDGDGMTDADEILAGTDRLNPQSLLSVQFSSQNSEMLQWQAVPGKVYEVECNEGSLINPVWTVVTVVTATTDSVQLAFPNDPEVQHAYYRIHLIQ